MSDFRGNNDPLNLYDEKKGEIINQKELKEDENVKDWSWNSEEVELLDDNDLEDVQDKMIPIFRKSNSHIRSAIKHLLGNGWRDDEHEKELFEQDRPKIIT